MQTRIYSELPIEACGYERLLKPQNVESYFFSKEWFSNLIVNGTDTNDRVRFYGVEDDSSQSHPLGLLAMRFCAQRGSWLDAAMLCSLSNFYTPLFGQIVDPSYKGSESVIKHLVSAICSDPYGWDIVDFKPLSAEAESYGGLSDAFQEAGWAIQRYFCFGNWFLKVEGRSFKKYFQALPSSLKNTIKRKRKKALLRGLRLELVTGGVLLEEGIRVFEEVYAESWKRPEPYTGFMPGLIRACADRGSLRLGIAYLDGQAAAVQVWIVENGTAAIYKLAYKEDFAEFSIGSILTAYMMEYSLDLDKVHTVDYLMGDDDYKKLWMSHRRERWGIRAFNRRTIPGLMESLRHIGGSEIKRRWQILTGIGRYMNPLQTR